MSTVSVTPQPDQIDAARDALDTPPISTQPIDASNHNIVAYPHVAGTPTVAFPKSMDESSFHEAARKTASFLEDQNGMARLRVLDRTMAQTLLNTLSDYRDGKASSEHILVTTRRGTWLVPASTFIGKGHHAPRQ